MTSKEYQNILQALNRESTAARLEWERATESFDALVQEVPSGLPHPDGVQRVHNASRELSLAREKFTTSTRRIGKFIVHREVPEDMKKYLRER